MSQPTSPLDPYTWNEALDPEDNLRYLIGHLAMQQGMLQEIGAMKYLVRKPELPVEEGDLGLGEDTAGGDE